MDPLWLRLIFSASMALVVLGNWFALRVGRNKLAGFRTRWTLQSSWTWRRTHKATTRLTAISLLPALLLLWLVPPTLGWLLPVFLAYILGTTGIGFVKSLGTHKEWKLWQQLGYDGPPQLAQQAENLLQQAEKSEQATA